MLIEMTPAGEAELQVVAKYTQIRISKLTESVKVEFLNKKNIVIGEVSVSYLGTNQDITISGLNGKLDVIKKFD